MHFPGHSNKSIVEICCCTKCYTEPVAPETSPVYSCYLSKLEIKFRSNSNPVYHLLLKYLLYDTHIQNFNIGLFGSYEGDRF